MTTVSLFAPELSGTAGLTLKLTKSSDYSAVNGAGDSLTESGTSGWFAADVAESWAETLAVSVVDGDGLIPRSGWLPVGATIVADVVAELDSASLRTALGMAAADLDEQLDAILSASGGEGGAGDWTDEEKAQIRYRLGLDGTATAPTDPEGELIVITPGTGSFTTGYLTCLDEEGEPLPDCPVYWRMIEAPPADTGYAYDASQATADSASNGVVECLKLVLGATYKFYRGKESDGTEVTIPSDAGATYELPSLRGY